MELGLDEIDEGDDEAAGEYEEEEGGLGGGGGVDERTEAEAEAEAEMEAGWREVAEGGFEAGGGGDDVGGDDDDDDDDDEQHYHPDGPPPQQQQQQPSNAAVGRLDLELVARLDRATVEHVRKLERDFGGRTRSALMARVRLEVPHATAAEVDASLRLLARQRGLHARRRALQGQWDERKKSFARACRELLQELAAQEGQEVAHHREASAMHERRAQLRAQLAALEAGRALRAEEAARAEAEAAAIQSELDEAARRRAEAERTHKRAQLQRHRDNQASAARRAEAAAAAAEAEAEAARLRQAEINVARVRHRARELELRQQLRREKDEQARLEEEEARRRLRLVTERVEAKMDVQSDPERILAGTAASTAPRADDFQMYPVQGYTDQKIMRDMRFRITEALTRAGLNQTQHARQTVAALASKAANNGGYHRAGLTSTVKLG